MPNFLSDLPYHFIEPVSDWFAVNQASGFLLVLLVFDVLTGIARAMKDRALNSRISRDGMFRKVGTLFLLALAVVIERFASVPMVTATSIALAIPEGMSIIENIALLGVPVPPFILEFFHMYGESLGPARKDHSYIGQSPTLSDLASAAEATPTHAGEAPDEEPPQE